MIDIETLFILGAGASVPYNYPSGKELRRRISKEIESELPKYYRHPIGDLTERFKDEIKYNIKELSETFFKSSTQSIDLFLSRNPKYSTIGKMAITYSILKAEIESKFREDMENISQDWYSYFYNRLTDELKLPESYKHFGDNKIGFITFNYDRSLEQFIHESFFNSFKEKDLERLVLGLKGTQELIPFEIVHIYGKIDNVQWQGGAEYGRPENLYRINQLKDNIRVIGESVIEEELLNAQSLIKNSKRIFFLGFGFAKENLEILKIPEILNHNSKVFGTAFGFTQKERNRILRLLNPDKRSITNRTEGISIKGNVWLSDMDCLSLLREWL